jgi:hypothetical protein
MLCYRANVTHGIQHQLVSLNLVTYQIVEDCALAYSILTDFMLTSVTLSCSFRFGVLPFRNCIQQYRY